MSKTDLIEELQLQTGLKAKAEQAEDTCFNHVAETPANGDGVAVRGLCSIFVKPNRAYAGRNPKMKEVVSEASKKTAIL